MKQQLIVFMAICAFAVAVVPRERRALNTEDEEHRTSSTSAKPLYCARHTPCAWSIYRPVIKMIETNIPNTYCTCEAGLACIIDEDDESASAYVHRCRTPVPEDSEGDTVES